MKGFAKVLTIALAALLCTSAVALAANSLGVTQPGLEGTGNKLSVTLDGSTNQTWVQDNTPVCEETYNWEIELASPGVLLDADDKIFLVNVRQETPADFIIRCTLRQAANGNNNVLNCLHRKEGGGFQYAGQVGYGLNAEPNIRMEVVRASGPGASDGIIRVYKNDALLWNFSNKQTFGTCIDRFRMGQTANILTPTPPSGEIQFDEVVTTR